MRRSNIITAIIITLALAALTAVFWRSYARLIEACKDLGLSVAYYFCELFAAEHDIVPSVK